MILLLDNYDSFTYNLYQYISEIRFDVTIIRNDKISIEDIQKLKPDAIIFSPGPGKPSDAGMMETIIKTYYRKIPMLGICLGHQAIAEVFGSRITHAKEMKHGEVSAIDQQQPSILFEGIAHTFDAGRYHSLVVEDLADDLEVIAQSKQGEIMALQHKQYPVYGVQFHPESLLTPDGKTILKNFMKGCDKTC